MSVALAIFDPFEPLAVLAVNDNNASGALAHVLELAYIDDQNQNVPETRSDYVKLGGMAIARVENKTTPFYSFSDHLGSAVAVWKQGGSIERERYTPFGITLDNPASLKDQAGFTGHIKDSATGLNYMQARYYDPVMGRFLSIDPVTFMDTGVTAQFNRYSYTANDPINMTDPNGECPWCIAGAVLGGGIQIFVEVRSGSFEGGVFSKQGLQALGRIGVSAGSGALGGGLGTAVSTAVRGASIGSSAARVAFNAVGSSVIGASQATANAAIDGRAPTSSELRSGALIGAALGGGGSAIGEGLEAVGRSIGSAARNTADDAAMAERMVQGGQLPGGMKAPDLPSGPPPSRSSAAGAVIGNATSNTVANSGPIVDELKAR